MPKPMRATICVQMRRVKFGSTTRTLTKLKASSWRWTRGAMHRYIRHELSQKIVAQPIISSFFEAVCKIDHDKEQGHHMSGFYFPGETTT